MSTVQIVGKEYYLKHIFGDGYRDPDRWPEIYEATTDAMARLEKAMKPAIAKLSI
jgi:hypothetical protein